MKIFNLKGEKNFRDGKKEMKKKKREMKRERKEQSGRTEKGEIFSIR